MHMADALVSPAVGGVMLAAAVGAAAVSIKKVKDMDEKKVPLMGVMSAFVFAAQMINFTIPGTGSSGHLGGGILLAVLLGPYAGYLSLTAILLIQALFFADGGFLAYGCNVINMGFFACFIAYPLIYKFITRKGITKKRLFIGCILASVVSLQMGSFSVVLETLFSGKTLLPFSQFAGAMQTIHLAIGVVEGFVTAAIVSFIWKVRPDIIQENETNTGKRPAYKAVLIGTLIAALLVGGIVSLFASKNPDGLEWSISKVAGVNKIEENSKLHNDLSNAQKKTAILSDYSLKKFGNEVKSNGKTNKGAGTVVSGIVGSAVTLGLILLIGVVINYTKRRRNNKQAE